MVAGSVEPEEESESEFEASDVSEEALTDPESSGLSSEPSDYNSDDNLTKKSKSKKKVIPKFKPKTRGKKFPGKGQKLNGKDAADFSEEEDGGSQAEEDDSMPEEDLDALDEETRIMTLKDLKEKRRNKRKADEERLAPIKKEEARMKKELGRKLTNGERNIIRLVRVSTYCICSRLTLRVGVGLPYSRLAD